MIEDSERSTTPRTPDRARMRIAELRGPRDFVVVEAPVPVPGFGEVLVDVAACGVCASELEHWSGASGTTYPMRIGHEVAGTVVGLGPGGGRYAIGDHVGVWSPGGGYADFVAVRESDCRPMPAALPLDQGLLEPIACATNAVEIADVRLADTVLIVGAGFMGLLVLQLVRLRGARTVVIADRRPDVLALAATLGATRTVDVAEESLVEVVAAMTDGNGMDLTFEVTGGQPALELVGEVTRMSGKVVLVGFHLGTPRQIPLGHWNWMAFDLRNAHFRDPAVIARGMTVGMQLVTAGLLQLGPLVTHRFDLTAIDDAFATAVAKPAGYVKAVVLAGDGREPRKPNKEEH